VVYLTPKIWSFKIEGTRSFEATVGGQPTITHNGGTSVYQAWCLPDRAQAIAEKIRALGCTVDLHTHEKATEGCDPDWIAEGSSDLSIPEELKDHFRSPFRGMGDPPVPDKEGECNAHIYLKNNWEDPPVVIRCTRPLGHPPPHSNCSICEGDLGPRSTKDAFRLYWQEDQRCYHLWEPVGSEEGRRLYLYYFGGCLENLHMSKEYAKDVKRHICSRCGTLSVYP